MKTKFSLTHKHVLQGLAVLAALVFLGMFREQLAVFAAWVSDRQAVSATMHGLGVWGPLVLFALLVLQVFLAIIPGHALVLAGGYVYGLALCLGITLAATILGSQVAFTIARRFGRSLIYRLASPQIIEQWDRLAANKGGLFYFFTFVLPFFPSDLMCYVAGLGTVSPRRFFAANVCGRFVCSLFITLVGSNGLQMPVWFWATALLIVIAFYAGWRWYSRQPNVTILPGGYRNCNRETQLLNIKMLPNAGRAN